MKLKTKRKKLEKLSIKKLNKLWGECVRKRANFQCEVCGREKVQAHHILTKGAYRNLRWDLENGIALCFTHHNGSNQSAHSDPVWFYNWICKYKDDPEFINKLILKGNTLHKQDRKLTYKLLTAYLTGLDKGDI